LIRLAAVADIHYDRHSRGRLGPHLAELGEKADVLLLAGDLTRRGGPEEAAALAEDLSECQVPMLAVLGNHDFQRDQEREVVEVLSRVGVRVLEGEGVVLEVNGERLGVAGVKGFAGGFAGTCATEFGEPEMKSFVRHSRLAAESLERALEGLDTPLKVALVHYSPVEATLVGEHPQVWPFLGSYFLAEAADRGGANLVLHGHAHAGSHCGVTPGGVPVRNVAQPVIRRAYDLFCLGDELVGD
jgi:Icc-related predicted phosphoesterase